MRILIDARESGTSTGRYVDKLVEYLHKLKPAHEISILTKSGRIKFFKTTCPDFTVIESSYKEFTFGEQYGLVWQLYGIKNDLIHFTMPQQPVLYFGRTITTIHDLTTTRFKNPSKNWLGFWLKQQVYKWVMKRVARKSKQLIAVSEFVKKDIAHYAKINPGKISVTYEAADKITVAAEPIKGLSGQTFLLYVGRSLPHKNLERLVQVLPILRHSNPDIKLVLAGKKDALYERLERKVHKQGIKGVVFSGFVSEGQLRWLYENCAAYVFPSLSEGFGLPGLEAMVHGAPVISSDATCLPEIYGEAALYFNPTNIQDMADKVNQVLMDERLRQRLIVAGHAQAEKYSWERMAQQTLDTYDKTLASD